MQNPRVRNSEALFRGPWLALKSAEPRSTDEHATGHGERISDWRREADVLSDRVAVPSVNVTREQPNDRLLIVIFTPTAGGAARRSLVVSEGELIVGAGTAMRFELDPLPGSRDGAESLMLAVIRGGLTERAGLLRIKFALRLQDGSVRTGGRVNLVPRLRRSGIASYAPYAPVDR